MTSHFKINGKMPRQAVLEQAITLTTQKRNREYGEPKENFERTADMLNAYLGKRLVDPLTAADIAMFGIVLKMGRLAENQKSDDFEPPPPRLGRQGVLANPEFFKRHRGKDKISMNF